MNDSLMSLFFEIQNAEIQNVYNKILKPWLKSTRYKEYFKNIKDQLLQGKVISQEDTWELYAFTRILDLLTLRFQPDNNADNSSWLGLDIKLDEYVDFVNELGFTTCNSSKFDPFYCEIVDAVEGEDDFNILGSYHPSILLGNLLIKRGGVKIELNPKKYNLDLINNTTLYWAYRRKNRPHNDLSHGWGSNSQWTTSIRFDFDNGNTQVYNAKGYFDLNSPTENVITELNELNLTIEEAIELTINRQFITSNKGEDQCPYDFKYTLYL